MPTMTLNLDPATLREATTQAIMGLLTPEVRAQMIQSAIAEILRPSTDSWNRGKTPLESAFESAVTQSARECVRDIVANDPEIQAKLKELARKTADAIFACDQEKMVERMADAFTSSMRADR